VNRLPIADIWLYYLLGATVPVVVLFGDFNLRFFEVFKKDFKLFSVQKSTFYIFCPDRSVDVVTVLLGEQSKTQGWNPCWGERFSLLHTVHIDSGTVTNLYLVHNLRM